MNDSATPEEKKKPGCFASFIILSIAWILVAGCWHAYQLITNTSVLPGNILFLFEYFRPENMDYRIINKPTIFFLLSLNEIGVIILNLLPAFLLQKGIIKLFWRKHSN